MSDFNACRFDFRLDAKNGLMPSKRKRMERSAFNLNNKTNSECCSEWDGNNDKGSYGTLYQCKICSGLFSGRAQLLEHRGCHSPQKLEAQQHQGQFDINSKSLNHHSHELDIRTRTETMSPTSAYIELICKNDNLKSHMNSNDVFDPTSINREPANSTSSTTFAAFLSKLKNNVMKCLPSDLNFPEDVKKLHNSEFNLTNQRQSFTINEEPYDAFIRTCDSGSLDNLNDIDSSMNSSVLDYSLKYRQINANILNDRNMFITARTTARSSDDFSGDILDLSCKQNRLNDNSDDCKEFSATPKKCVSSDVEFHSKMNVEATKTTNNKLNSLDECEPSETRSIWQPDLNFHEELADKEPRSDADASETDADNASCYRTSSSLESPTEADAFSFRKLKRPSGKDLSDTVNKLWKNKIGTEIECNSSNRQQYCNSQVNILQIKGNKLSNKDSSIFMGEMEIPRLSASEESSSVLQPPVVLSSPDDFCTLKFRACPICRQLFSTSKAMWIHRSVHKDYKRSKLLKVKYDLDETTTDNPAEMKSGTNLDVSKSFDVRLTSKYETSRDKPGHCTTAEANESDTTIVTENDFILKNTEPSTGAEDSNKSPYSIGYRCDFPDCDKIFKQQRHLEVHRVIHTGGDQIGCILCRYSCRHSSSMSWHMNTKHGLVRRRLENGDYEYAQVDAGEKIVGNVSQGEKVETPRKVTPRVKSTCRSALKAKIKTKSINSIMKKHGLGSFKDTKLELLNNSSYVLDAFAKIIASGSNSFQRFCKLNSTLSSSAADLDEANAANDCNETVQNRLPDGSDKSFQHNFLTPTKVANKDVLILGENSIKSQDADKQEQHTGSNNLLTCSLCCESFTSNVELIKHLISYHSIKMDSLNKCHICDLLLASPADLVNHISSSHGIKLEASNPTQEFSCYVCGVSYNSEQELQQHFQKHENANSLQYACPCGFCSSRHNSKASLKNHIRRMHLAINHWPTNQPKQSKSVSAPTIEDYGTREPHEPSHEPSNILDVHNEIKTEEKNECLEENQREENVQNSSTEFSYQNDGNLNTKQHDKPTESTNQSNHQQFEIEQQEKQQQQEKASELDTEHNQYSEPQHGGVKLGCLRVGCARAFDSVTALLNHLTAHAEERPLACDFTGCDKTFREMKHLKVHRMQHTDFKPLLCQLCEYSCRQRNSMNWHMKSKHNLEKHVTSDGKTFYA